jgi:nucleotide-binding universal stress UspA family protein
MEGVHRPSDIRRILCAIDFSEFSRQALAHAAALAGRHGAQLTVLHVVTTAQPSIALTGLAGAVPAVPAVENDDVQRQVRDFAAAAAGAHGPIEVTVVEGNPAREIVRAAEHLPADLLVLGTHGRGGFERFFLGSVTEKVLRSAAVPILTIPPASSGPVRTQYGTILCPVDLAEASAAAIEEAVSLARPAGARLVLLHVIEPYPDLVQAAGRLPVTEQDRRRIEAEALRLLDEAVPADARGWLTHEARVAFGKAPAEIIRIAGDVGADLIVMARQGRDAVDRWVFGSTIPRVVREATCPVLTLRV